MTGSTTRQRVQFPTSASAIVRRGITMTELIVASTLLVAGISMIVPLAVRTSQLWKESRHYQLAIEELQNQMERLTSLDPEQLEKLLGEIKLSLPAQHALANPKISCALHDDAEGDRLVLSLSWGRPGMQRLIILVGWLPEKSDAREVEP